ncbi:hypothetical protein BOTBODRAFT_33862 [Botryobasidium botryosum FD-172 SS1]|uniref:Thioredoxin domain-containing protein n=1 Tax=Botryobasidium botryosum (strain FD-172 SS1) TaxID=930990 RepID=A0A067MCG9_BOTB1|nr:hypothetical protein BOTBODRAFT_33862 [Botryobasidium botryosum FD-172 SS1]
MPLPSYFDSIHDIQTYEEFKKVICEESYSIIVYWYPRSPDASLVHETVAQEHPVLRDRIYFVSLGGLRFGKDPLREGIKGLLVVRIYRSGQLLDEVKGYNAHKIDGILEDIEYELDPTANPYWALTRPNLNPGNFVAYPY